MAAAWTTLASYILLFVFHWYIAKKIDNNHMFPTRFIIESIVVLSIFSAWILFVVDSMAIRWGSMVFFITIQLGSNFKIVLPIIKGTFNKFRKE